MVSSFLRDRPSRRRVLAGLAATGFAAAAARPQPSRAAPDAPVTLLFCADIHACRMASGLSPHCAAEGKTDASLRSHVAGLNGLRRHRWPTEIDGRATGLSCAGAPIDAPRGLVVGGDMTDDGGGQTAQPSEGTQLLQFSQRYQQGVGPERIHMPVYVGLGNHDLDQDGPPPHQDWYRRELRDYVEVNHRPSVIFHPLVPVDSYDAESDCYSWNWGRLHLVQGHRFIGDTNKSAPNSLPWLKSDLETYAGDGRPVILFQHYGWDPFSVEHWDPEKTTFDDTGRGPAHWWTAADRAALLDLLSGYNVIGLFHGHEHDTPMIYRAGSVDLFKPIAAFKGGFALARVSDRFMDVVLGEVAQDDEVRFTLAFTKEFAGARK
ncbi:MAG: metallophosphoesterase [Rhizobiaceae bacterium]|nr:metallophosphoesterase [Rhizobiaceae bacterium]